MLVASSLHISLIISLYTSLCEISHVSSSLCLQPFGQVPAFEDGDLTLFGEIVVNSATYFAWCDIRLKGTVPVINMIYITCIVSW